MGQDVDLWIRELKAAGWEQVQMTVWKSPSGHLFRGPFKAWELMHAHPELGKPMGIPAAGESAKAKRVSKK